MPPRKTVTVVVRMTRAERAEVNKLAKLLNLSLSEMLRTCITIGVSDSRWNGKRVARETSPDA